jgi:nitroreductase
MTDFMHTLLTRRSIRKFKSDKISEEITNKILKAAMYAPSARNTLSWQFLVINKKETLETLAEIHPYGKMLKEAPLAILVAGDKSLESNENYLAINCAAATENILLAAHSLQLGSVWLGIYPKLERMKAMVDLFKLPAEIIPISLVAIGYPNEEKDFPQRYFPEKIHFNNW